MQSVTFQLTAVDLVDARLFVHKRSPLVRAVWLLVAAVAIGSALRMLFLAVQQDWGMLPTPALWLGGAIALYIWGVVGNTWLLPPSARKQLLRDKGLQGDMVAAWDDENVVLRGSHGQSRWPWSDLYKWQESPRGFLLWHNDRSYFYLPKRSLTEPQVVNLRETLKNSAKAAP